MDGYLAVALVAALAALPLALVLASAPPMTDDTDDEMDCENGNSEGRSNRTMNIFQRAHQGLNLSPEERAFLKLVQGFVITALVAAAGTLVTVASNGATLHDGVLAVAVSFAVTLILAVAKYFSANGQSALGGALTGIAGDLEQRFGLPAAKVEAPVPASAAAGSAPPAA